MKMDPKKWRWENSINDQLSDHGEKLLQESIRKLIDGPKPTTAKGVDIFGRNAEQVEMARLNRAGRKGIRVK